MPSCNVTRPTEERTVDIGEADSYVGTLLDDGRVAVDIGDTLTLIGTRGELLALGATITSMAYVDSEVA